MLFIYLFFLVHNPETSNRQNNGKQLKHELLDSEDENANEEKENSFNENDSSSDLDNINPCKVLLSMKQNVLKESP